MNISPQSWPDSHLHEIGERRPSSPSWSRHKKLESVIAQHHGRDFGLSCWQVGRFSVASSLIRAELPTGIGVGPQWLVSISRKGSRRPTQDECRRLLRHLGLGDAEEDNHESGVARKYFQPLDPAQRVDCHCKADDEQVVDPDGYPWSRAKEVAL